MRTRWQMLSSLQTSPSSQVLWREKPDLEGTKHEIVRGYWLLNKLNIQIKIQTNSAWWIEKRMSQVKGYICMSLSACK